MAQHRPYLERETLKGILISIALSLVFALLVLGIQPMIPIRGPRGLILDAAPQTFMVTLLGTLVPTITTRRDVREGKIGVVLSSKTWPLPRNPFLRALCFAAPITVIGAGAHALVLPRLGAEAWPFALALFWKGLYGAALAATVVPIAVRRAFADRYEA